MKKGIAQMKKASVLSITVLVVILFSASYAFFGTTTTKKTEYITNFEGNGISYVMETVADLSIQVDPVDLLSGDADYYESVPGEMTVTLGNAEIYTSVQCAYEIWYRPVTGWTNSAEATDLEEMVVVGTDSSGYNTAFMFNLDGITDDTKLADGSILVDGQNTQVTQNWTFTLRHYNLDVNQDDNKGKKFEGTIEIVPGDCEDASTSA